MRRCRRGIRFARVGAGLSGRLVRAARLGEGGKSRRLAGSGRVRSAVSGPGSGGGADRPGAASRHAGRKDDRDRGRQFHGERDASGAPPAPSRRVPHGENVRLFRNRIGRSVSEAGRRAAGEGPVPAQTARARRRRRDVRQRRMRSLHTEGDGIVHRRRGGRRPPPRRRRSREPAPRRTPAPPVPRPVRARRPGHGFAPAPPPAGFPTVWAKSANRVGGSARAAAISSGRSDPRNTVCSPAAAQCR